MWHACVASLVDADAAVQPVYTTCGKRRHHLGRPYAASCCLVGQCAKLRCKRTAPPTAAALLAGQSTIAGRASRNAARASPHRTVQAALNGGSWGLAHELSDKPQAAKTCCWRRHTGKRHLAALTAARFLLRHKPSRHTHSVTRSCIALSGMPACMLQTKKHGLMEHSALGSRTAAGAWSWRLLVRRPEHVHDIPATPLSHIHTSASKHAAAAAATCC
jgi:hypothetical protein